MCKTKNCYKTCINKNFLLEHTLLTHAQEILAELKTKSTTNIGRPSIDFSRAINGVYYLLKTGIHWKALPHCFGSPSAVHRTFQKLRSKGFFEKLWHKELQEYDRHHGLQLEVQAGDCSHVKSPLGQDQTGKSPVDRKKLGTKRSIIVEQNGIVVGCALGAGNRHDSKLFEAAIRSIPSVVSQPYYKEMHLDCAYDSKDIRVILFNLYYVPKISINKRNSEIIPTQKSERKRWVVESTHSWMNRFRRLLIRFEKLANNYVALIHFAVSIMAFNKL